MVADTLRFLARVIFKFYSFKIEGIEKVPLSGKLIVACNHCSNADPPAVEISLHELRHPRFMAKKELFSVPFVGRALRQINAIPVERQRAGGDLSAMRSAIEALDNGDCVAIFPEGTRAKKGVALKPKRGVSYLAHKTGAPVLTARIFGTKNFPFGRRITLKFGAIKRFNCENIPDADLKMKYDEFAQHIMSEIYTIKEDNATASA